MKKNYLYYRFQLSVLAIFAFIFSDQVAAVGSASTYNYNQVFTTTFNPVPGKNTLNFVVRNWGVAGSVSNPTGILYKAEVNYCPTASLNTRLVGHAYWSGTSNKAYSLKAPMENGYDTTSAPARVISNSLCSAGDPSYKLFINNDIAHTFPFPVFGKLPTDQYDLVLSPVINQAKRSDDIRVVVSWVGGGDLGGGFLIPVSGSGKYNDGTLKPFIAPGPTYYSKANVNGIWYHGFGSTSNKVSSQAFTLNTTTTLKNGTPMIDEQYIFYVHVNGDAALTNGGIKRASKDGRLKVDVYLPEADTDDYHFARPSFTFYGTNGIPTQNDNTTYWEVMALRRASPGDTPADRIVPINKFISEKNFK